MHIIFFSHYFPPEGNAPASRTYEHCVRWLRAGHQVTVITCVPNVPNGVVYDGYRNRWWPQRENVDGIDVLRVWTFVAANAGGAKRIINYLSYCFSSLLGFVFWTRRPDVILATSPQFFCGWAGVFASWIKWRPLILEIRDMWPESITTVGALKKGFVIRVLEVLEKWMYRSSARIVAVGNGYRQKILEKVAMPERISVITNGVDLSQYPVAPRSERFRNAWSLNDRFVCSYAGTIGMAHGLDVVLRAATRLRQSGRRDIVFCLIGDGAERSRLQRDADTAGLADWIRFTGRLDKSEMATALASSDALLVHLKKCDLFETVIPSKIFEAMAMNRPIVMGVRGESAEIVRRAGCGVDIEPDNDAELVETVERLADDRPFYDSLARNGRSFVAAHYSRDVLASQYLDLIEQVVSESRNGPTGTVSPDFDDRMRRGQ
jgi:glycosyltransferase involved in cell wall biosynthesis